MVIYLLGKFFFCKLRLTKHFQDKIRIKSNIYKNTTYIVVIYYLLLKSSLLKYIYFVRIEQTLNI